MNIEEAKDERTKEIILLLSAFGNKHKEAIKCIEDTYKTKDKAEKPMICNACGGIMKHHKNEPLFIDLGDIEKKGN